MSLAKTVGAPVEIELGGKTYLMSPIVDELWAQFENFLKQEYLDFYRENINKEDDPSLRESLMAHAYDRASGLSLTSPEIISFMQTFNGMSKLIHLSLSVKHPDVTIKFVRKELMHEQTQKMLFSKLDDVLTESEVKETEKQLAAMASAAVAAAKKRHTRKVKSISRSRKSTASPRKKSRK